MYLGFFRREELVAAGGWDERFERNQDFELNRRLGQAGVVWFEASLPVTYVPVRTLSELWRQYVQFGRWKVRYWRLTGDRPRAGQWLLLAMPVVALGSALALVRRFGSRAILPPAVGAGAVLIWKGESPVAVRVATIAATGVSGAAWTLGIWLELAAGER